MNKLIRCLEIYLSYYVDKVRTKDPLADIERLPYLDKVLSFNYTNTFEKLYDKYSNIEYDYIHGKADINNSIETNNMVMGIDEYLKEKKKFNQLSSIWTKKIMERR